MAYDVDMRDVKFQLFEWLPTAKLLEAPKFGDWDRDSVEMVLDEGYKIAREQMAPSNVEGDRIGVQWKDGVVTMPPAFKSVYQTVREGGWMGMVIDSASGGMGLPEVVGTAVTEFFSGSNVSLCLTIMLTRGAAMMIDNFGTDHEKGLYFEKLLSGEWAGTMCLTEPQAGSDVGAAKTKAVKQDDGTYLISGEKIFITSGDHDLTDNIVHLVLARTPDAAPGTKGLSLFIVPKVWVNEDGTLGESNDVYCSNIEKKMGIHGSPTCSLVFGGNGRCRGYLLGKEQGGMKLMFFMMNGARIEVGLQGSAAAAGAYQAALTYARERLQSRSWKEWDNPAAPQVPIIEHPDVRRLLLSSKAYSEAMRALLYQTALYEDLSRISKGAEQEKYHSYVEVLTPICKAWASDWGVQVGLWCMQVYGGYGYTKEFPVEQYVRDAEIATIYEGTNGIQALDFVGRKLRLRDGEAVRELLGMAEKTFNSLKSDNEMGEAAWMLAAALKQIESMAKDLPKRPDGMLVTIYNAVPILDMVGTVLGAHFLLDQARIAKAKLGEILAAAGVVTDDKKAYKAFLAGNPDAAFYHNKVQAAIHFAYRGLPLVSARAAAVRAGEKSAIYAVL
ncbi:MAG: acyl-CoA dehydrogenase [Holophagae bacterium]|nr:MAG: acyl-CoA dehydrogenase [Holophagae bacterium]